MTAVYAATLRGEYIRRGAVADEKELAALGRDARSSLNERTPPHAIA
jgi:hypothetical protein